MVRRKGGWSCWGWLTGAYVAMQAAHRQVLVEGAQARLQVGDRQLTSALHVEKVKGSVQLGLVNGQASRAGKALELVLTQPNDGVHPPARY